MSNDARPLTRKQIAEFMPNHEAVRSFEKTQESVFKTLPNDIEAVGQSVPDSTDELTEGATNLYHTTERAQDAAWSVLTGVQTLISVTYNDAANSVSFVVNGNLSNYDNSASQFIRNVISDDFEITDAAKGVILTSPDSTRWRVTVDNAGALSVDAV